MLSFFRSLFAAPRHFILVIAALWIGFAEAVRADSTLILGEY
jgi:hypothetical protein